VYDEISAPGGFWEKPLRLGEMIDVGLKSGYVASWYGTPLMIDSGGGLIVFTSATGAVHYSMGPAYGAHKAGVDKMSFDMATEFQAAGVPVTSVSLWMGAVLTDRLKNIIAADREKFAYLEGICETPEFTGHVIWALANDPDRIGRTGQTLIGAELAIDYGVKDENDRQPPSFRDTHGVAPHVNYPLVIR
jgi:NAD(P)-dependent dehydrogenase (short-subunit alcohol dehydrogenase family)